MAGGSTMVSSEADKSLFGFTPARLAAILYVAAALLYVTFGCLYRYRWNISGLEADELDYFTLSTSLMSGDMYPILGRRTAAYPALLAVVRMIYDNLFLMQVVVTLIYSISVPALFLVVWRFCGSLKAALFAALALMVWPPAVFYGTSLYSEGVALPFFLIMLYLLPVGSRLVTDNKTSAGYRFLIAGLALGITTHIRPMYLLFVPFVAAIIIVEERKIGRSVARFAQFMAGFLLMILPWSAYVSHTLQSPILIASNGGETLSGGLNPKLFDEHTYRGIPVKGRDPWIGPGKWLNIADNGYVNEQDARMPYQELDKVLTQRTIRWIVNNPYDAAYLQMAKLSYMWGIYPLLKNGTFQFWFGSIPTVALLATTFALLFRKRELRAQLFRFWILAVFVSCVALISWGSWRFRQTGDAGLIAFCAIALAHQYGKRGSGTSFTRART